MYLVPVVVHRELHQPHTYSHRRRHRRSNYLGTANFIDGAEIEGDFFSYCDNLTDERDDLCY